jgi:hypothetical protein
MIADAPADKGAGPSMGDMGGMGGGGMGGMGGMM